MRQSIVKNSVSRAYVLIEKLLTPIALTLPVVSTCSIKVQVWLNVGYSASLAFPFSSLGNISCSGELSESGSRQNVSITVIFKRHRRMEEVLGGGSVATP